MLGLNSIRVQGEGIGKKFGPHKVFEDIGFDLKRGVPVAITGPNGSGKSTLLEIIAGLQVPSSGSLFYYIGDSVMHRRGFRTLIGFMSPRLNLYEELSGIENIEFILHSRNLRYTAFDDIVNDMEIKEYLQKPVKQYSSGMKQRLKFIQVLLHDPPVLFLDEPGTNLDSKGKELLYSRLRTLSRDKLVVIATNEKAESDLCREKIVLA